MRRLLPSSHESVVLGQAVFSHTTAVEHSSPEGGCVGFAFTLRGFEADNANHRPKPTAFPTDDKQSPWQTIGFDAVARKEAGACFYDAKKNQVPTLGGACQPAD